MKIWLEFIRIDSDLEVSDSVGLIFKRFSKNKIENSFSDWFGMIHIGSEWIRIRNFRLGLIRYIFFIIMRIRAFPLSYEMNLYSEKKNIYIYILYIYIYIYIYISLSVCQFPLQVSIVDIERKDFFEKYRRFPWMSKESGQLDNVQSNLSTKQFVRFFHSAGN